MTISEVLAKVDEIKPNQYPDEIKAGWIAEIDYKVYEEIMKNHEDCPESYEEPDYDDELLIPAPYTNTYIFYLEAMIDYMNNETERYTNSMIMFNNAYSEFGRAYNRNHLPISNQMKLF